MDLQLVFHQLVQMHQVITHFQCQLMTLQLMELLQGFTYGTLRREVSY